MTYDAEKIRNVVLMGQAGSGKTSLVEGMVSTAHALMKTPPQKGEDKISSTEPEELAHEVTITPHFGYFEWNDHFVTLADIPGNYNFFEGSRAVLPGVEGAIVLFSGTQGVKVETERLWAMLTSNEIPAIAFVNEMDEPEADLAHVMQEIEEILEVEPVLISFPIKDADGLKGVVDLIHVQAWKESESGSKQIDIPEELMAEIHEKRAILIEKAAETRDEYILKFIEGQSLTPDEIEEGLKIAVRERRFLPIACGRIRTHIGLRALMDDIVSLLPPPSERHKVRPLVGFEPQDLEHKITRDYKTDAPFSAIVLKTTIDQFSGRVSVVRVVSGELKANQQILNTTHDTKQKSPHVYRVMGKELIEVDALSAGEIGALVKIEETYTGDTLCDPDHPIIYPPVRFPDAGISFAVEVEKGSEEKVSLGLTKLAAEDPTLHLHRDEITHEMILGGSGPLHLEITMERLKRKFGGEATLKTPRVPYRESIRSHARAQGKVKKQTGGHGQFANCFLEIDPLPRNEGFKFENRIVGGVIPKQYIPSVEKGVHQALENGVLGGYPLVDLKVSLVDGSFHSVDSSDFAFQNAGAIGLKAAVKEASPVLLEPIMAMEIVFPEDLTGDIVKDISQRRGRVLGMFPKASRQKVKAEVPLAEVLDYGNTLNSITSGRGHFAMNIETYREVPEHLLEKILASREQVAA